MKVDHFDVQLDTPPSEQEQHIYLAGEDIKGLLQLDVREPVPVAHLSLRLLGVGHTKWLNKFETRDVAFEGSEVLMDECLDLTGEMMQQQQHFTTGQEEHKHRIQFAIKIPTDSVSSIEKEGFGSIKYFLTATLNILEEQGDSEIVAERELSVKGFLCLDSPHFEEPVQSTEQWNAPQGYCLRLLLPGKLRRYIRATLCVSKLGLLAGESCNLLLTIENTIKKSSAKKHKGEHSCALISLCQQVDFRAKSKQMPFTWERKSLTTAVQSYDICKANCKKGPETRRVDFHIPVELPPTTTKETGLIKCNYFFRFGIDEHFEVIVPVVVGSHKAQPEQQMEDNIVVIN